MQMYMVYMLQARTYADLYIFKHACIHIMHHVYLYRCVKSYCQAQKALQQEDELLQQVRIQ